ncbi:MAG: hypothetical protein ACT4NL_02660 [Pseudomarimonas sp.]
MRALSVAVLATMLVAASGCSWFRGKSDYENAVEARSLEVPPDLDTPRVDPAMSVPVVGAASVARPATSGSTAAPAIVASGPFPVNDSVESTWRRLGIALERTEGVEIVERAQVLAAYNVRFDGAEFLVRVTRDGETSQVGAVDSKGGNVTGGAAGKLLAVLRTRLS